MWATPRRPIPKSRLFNAFAVFGRDPAYVLMLEPVRIRPPGRVPDGSETTLRWEPTQDSKLR